MPDPNLRTLGRLLLLGVTAIPIFIGFALPFAMPGATGLALAVLFVLGGAGLLRWVERRTQSALKHDTALNRTLKAEGDNLVERD